MGREFRFGLFASLLGCLASCEQSSDRDVSAFPTAPVISGELRVSVTEGGDMNSAKPVSVRSEVEGMNTIIELIPEGTQVEKDEVVAKLDSSQLEEKINRKEGEVERARSAVFQAEQDAEIQRKKNQEDQGRAEAELELAKRALQGYLEGEFPLQLRQLQSDETIAKERLARAEDDAAASQRLFDESHISRTELLADQLKLKQAQEEVEIAGRKVEQLEKWTKPDKLRELGAEVQFKMLALDRVQQQVASSLKQKEDQLAERQNTLKLEQELYEKTKSQLFRTTIRAPIAGLVVYGREQGGRMRGDEPMAVGKSVREREEIVRIPDMSSMIVEVDIHESAIKKVARGAPAIVRVDALPNQVFRGRVTSVAIVPSSQSSWLNPDLKVYMTRVEMDEVPPGVKPGMHAQVEIVTSVLSEVIQVPVQAVRQSGSRSFVYVKSGSNVVLREVTVGQHNDKMVEVAKGLDLGEEVFLKAPPWADPLPSPENPAAEVVKPTDMVATPPPADAGVGTAPPADGEGPRGSRGTGGGPGSGRKMPTFEEMQQRRPELTREQYDAMVERMKGGAGRRPPEDPARD